MAMPMSMRAARRGNRRHLLFYWMGDLSIFGQSTYSSPMGKTLGAEILFVDDRPEDGRIRHVLTFLLNKLSTRFDLDLRGLRRIVVTPSVDEATKLVGSRDWSALNVMANATGAAFTERREGQIETTIAIARDRVELLLDPKSAPAMIHTLHHELAHAHDHRENHWIVEAYTGLGAPTNARALAVMIWAEYFAALRSGPTAQWEDIDLRARGLAHQIREHGLALHEIGEMANGAPNPAKLLEAALRIGREWLYTAALTRGYLDAFEIDAIAHEELTVWLHDSNFEPLWERMTAILRNLHGRYGDWTTPDALEPLTVIVRDFFDEFGFTFAVDGEGLEPSSRWSI
jgi:hypothetical protein